MAWDWEKLREQQEKNDRKNVPPQMDDLVDQFKNFKLPGGIFIIVFLVIAGLLGMSTFYTVGVSEVGMVQRFGKFVRETEPGLHFKWPAGIEVVRLVPVKQVFNEEFGYKTVQTTSRSRVTAPNSADSESLMLTGDLNVALVPWIVQYRIKEPYNFLYKVRDPKILLRDMSESSMRLVVGDRSINEVISKRSEIAVEAKSMLQKEMDEAETGIHIVTIEMKKTNVPEKVQSSFNEVNQAVQEKEKLIYQAQEDYNKAIPAARGEAERTIKAAEGYALDRINRARGDAARFTSLYSEYKNAKDITRRRLYLDMIQDLYPKIGRKFIVDDRQNQILPLLNLGQKMDGNS